MKKLFCDAITWLPILFWACQSSSELIISEDSNSDYQIIVPSMASEEEQKAASELQLYFQKMNQVLLPIVSEEEAAASKGIWVGATQKTLNADLDMHQILIQEQNEQLIILGGSPKSTLYAVYSFLEHFLGCRFYAPEVEYVPQLTAIKVQRGLNYSYEPPVTTRTVHSRLYYENHDFADKRKVTYEAFPGYIPSARVHTFHRFVPEGQYFQDHPEYYALRDGRRIPTQLCLTNPEVLQIVLDTVAALIEEFPEAEVISVSQDDNQQYCQCVPCTTVNEREGAPSGSVLEFVNQVARAFPDKLISTLAYQYTRKPPQLLKPEENVLVTLCSIECDRSAPIADNCQAFTKDLIAWGEKTDKVRIWDYTTQFTNFLAPFPNLRTLQPNVKLFVENNAKWVFEQHSNNPSELFELRSYLTAKLLWDPQLNVDSVVNDFLTGYYQEAGIFVGKYINAVHDELEANPDFFLFLYGDPSQAFSSFLKPDLLKKYDDWYDQAEEAVADNPEVLQRVQVARLSVDFAILEASRKKLSPELSMVETDQSGNKTAPNRIKRRLENFQNSCLLSHIELMNETGYTVDEYLSAYENTLQRAQQTNKALGGQVNLLQAPKKYADENPQTLTDGAFGGSSFYANWLGFEGNDLEAIIDLREATEFEEISSAFLQVTNHTVFLPEKVSYYSSNDGKVFHSLGTIPNPKPLSRDSKVNDIEYFTLRLAPKKARYIKIAAKNVGEAPIWHHFAGLPAWIFIDEVMVR